MPHILNIHNINFVFIEIRKTTLSMFNVVQIIVISRCTFTYGIMVVLCTKIDGQTNFNGFYNEVIPVLVSSLFQGTNDCILSRIQCNDIPCCRRLIVNDHFKTEFHFNLNSQTSKSRINLRQNEMPKGILFTRI